MIKYAYLIVHKDNTHVVIPASGDDAEQTITLYRRDMERLLDELTSPNIRELVITRLDTALLS